MNFTTNFVGGALWAQAVTMKIAFILARKEIM